MWIRKILLVVLIITRIPWCVAEEQEIKIGMSTVLSGPAANLGKEMSLGVQVAIDEANMAGGIHGRKLKLIALDDGYEPARTIPNMKRLIESEEVVAIVGNVGTPTAVVAVPMANERRVPFFGAFTGAGILRKTPPDRYIVNFRASYVEETAEMVNGLVNNAGIKPEEIAFFTQRDAYGDAGFSGGIQALKRHGLKDERQIQHVRYERNSVAVEKPLAELLLIDPPPKAVIMVGAYAPSARFIKLARENRFAPLFLNVSFVGSDSLAETLGTDGDGVIITQVVPPVQSDLPLVKEFRQALKVGHPQQAPSEIALEGYAVGRVLIRALHAFEGIPTREKLADAFEGLGAFDIGLGEELVLNKERHQACHRVWPSVLKGGKVVPFAWERLSSDKGNTP